MLRANGASRSAGAEISSRPEAGGSPVQPCDGCCGSDTLPSCRVSVSFAERLICCTATVSCVDNRGHVRNVLAFADFRRLYATRLAAQFGDGVFQASLAGAILFNPERQTDAADVAAGFAVILLPYSLVGPFAGVLLDRWWRQRVLCTANLL